jgi:HEAT repeat protein
VMLGIIHQDWATQMLVEGLDNEFGAEREQAILSLGQSGDPSVAKKIEKFINTQGLVFATLEALGHLDNPDSSKVVERQLKSKSSLVRAYAAAALWRLGEEEAALEVLVPMSTDEDAATRLNVAQLIVDIKNPAAMDLLSSMVKDEDGSVRLAAVQALGAFNDPTLVPLFVEALTDASYQVYTSALDSLAGIGTPELLEQLAPFLENQNPYVKMSAANAILAIANRGGGAA